MEGQFRLGALARYTLQSPTDLAREEVSEFHAVVDQKGCLVHCGDYRISVIGAAATIDFIARFSAATNRGRRLLD